MKAIQNIRIPAALLCASLIFGAACSDDASNNNANTNNTANNNTNNNNTNGDATKTKYDVDVTGGMNAEVKNEIDNTQASQQNGGVAIADGQINLFLVAPNGNSINAVIATTEAAPAPASYALNAPPEPNYAVYLAPLAGGTFSSASGSIKIDNCPTKVGDKLVGSFVNVAVSPDAGGDQGLTLNGTFDLYVYSMVGTLFCKPVDNNNNNNTNNNNNNNNNSCSADECAEGGTCCPYMQCLAQCQLQCVTSDPACIDPFNADPIACAACANACLDSCNVDQACRAALTDLGACESDNGCDEIEDEDQADVCLKGACCSEINAAF